MKPTRLCPVCRRSGFTRHEGFNRPRFICQSCRHHWTNGLDGGEYAGGEQNKNRIEDSDYCAEAWRDARAYPWNVGRTFRPEPQCP
jgi:hypothetical protein